MEDRAAEQPGCRARSFALYHRPGPDNIRVKFVLRLPQRAGFSFLLAGPRYDLKRPFLASPRKIADASFRLSPFGSGGLRTPTRKRVIEQKGRAGSMTRHGEHFMGLIREESFSFLFFFGRRLDLSGDVQGEKPASRARLRALIVHRNEGTLMEV